MAKTAVAEYVDYTTIHGVERIKNSPFKGFKIIWLIALFTSLGMITFQVVILFRKYDSHPISTSIEVKTVKKMKFPMVVICNTNPVQYNRFPSSFPLEVPLNEAAEKYGIDSTIYRNITSSENLFTYNYTNFDKASVPKTFDADIMVNTAEKFKMMLSNLSDIELKNFSQPYDEFVMSCIFAGKPCSQYAMGNHNTFRTYDYGLCYVFDPTEQDGISPSGEVYSSGQRYGLELLLNVDQFQSVPFVTKSNGVVIFLTYDVDEYLDKHARVFVPTGFQADIAILKDCLRDCRQENISKKCGCYQHFFLFDNQTRKRPCLSDEDYVCILKALDEFTNSTPSECKCIVPCREEFYTSDVTLISWPNEKYLPILRRIMQAKLPGVYMGFDRNTIRDNFLLVRMYLEALSYELIKKSYEYEIVNFLSDIGGQLGLWAGFSVLSFLEIVELVFLLLAKKVNKTEKLEGDGKTNKEKQEGSLDTRL